VCACVCVERKRREWDSTWSSVRGLGVTLTSRADLEWNCDGSVVEVSVCVCVCARMCVCAHVCVCMCVCVCMEEIFR